MSRKIRIGAIGIGGISNGVHIPGIMTSNDLELMAVCDNDPVALKRAKERYGIDDAYCFSDYQDLIRCPDVDAVDISTPNDAHYDIALAAVQSEKPFSLEKPITLTSIQADELCSMTLEYQVKNMICFSYRFKSAARMARDLVQRGVIGDIYHIYGQFLQGWGGSNVPLVWRYIKKRTGSGALGDLGSHILDLATFVTGKDYVKVTAHTDTYIKERKLLNGEGYGSVDVDDYCHVMAEMDGKTSATFEVSRFAYGRDHQTLEIYGSKGALIYTNDSNIGDHLQVCAGSPYADTQQFTDMIIPVRYKVSQMQSFADIINEKQDGLAATIVDGKKNQHVMDAVLISANTGSWVYVDK